RARLARPAAQRGPGLRRRLAGRRRNLNMSRRHICYSENQEDTRSGWSRTGRGRANSFASH
ncbi:hypothetical protein, partial [Burkholderia sp. Ac-20353]|uniref:hypothetical protein n=1 Tax=Burkholderia sp. Ac-20353 TaxID=2703894 RepID=UPI002402A683